MGGNRLVLRQKLSNAASGLAETDSMALMIRCLEILRDRGVTRDGGRAIQWHHAPERDHLITNVLLYPGPDEDEILLPDLDTDLRRENTFNLAYKVFAPVDAEGNLFRGRAMDVRAYTPSLAGEPGIFMLLVLEDLMRVNRHDPDMQQRIKEAACEMAGQGVFRTRSPRPGACGVRTSEGPRLLGHA